MLTLRELRRMAAQRQVSLGALEKDYALSTILRRLYAQQPLQDLLILKGGTAIHKLFLHQRLSLDLDFVARRAISLTEIQSYLEAPELQAQVKEYQVFHDALTIHRLRFLGPLGYPNALKVDISFRESPVLPPLTLLLETPYYKPFPVTVMQLEEMTAEKIRAALMRKAPRDYFDLWLLLQETTLDVASIPRLVLTKLETVKVAWDPEPLWRGLETLKGIWQADLRELLPQVPDFDTLVRDLRQGLPALLP